MPPLPSPFEGLGGGLQARLVACALVAGAIATTVSRLMLANHANVPVPEELKLHFAQSGQSSIDRHASAGL